MDQTEELLKEVEVQPVYFTDEKERNALAEQYTPLVKKISHNMAKDSPCEYEEIEGFAWIGFTKALNEYDPTKSDMSFLSFAAYGIRNAILSGSNRNGRTIRISYYKQKQMRANEEEIPSVVSLNKNFENEDHLRSLGIEDEPEFDDGWDALKNALDSHFPDAWTDMFYSVYGLYGHHLEKSKDVAKRQNISGCLVTKRMKKMIEFIQQDENLCDILRDLL